MLFTQSRSRRTQASAPVSVAAPVGGWNDRDPLGKMGKLDAVRLENLFPSTGSVQLRKGYTAFTNTGPLGQNETLMAYSSATSNKMFAAVDDSIYDVTGGTYQSPLSGLSNARWQYVNFTTSAGSYLLAVNGADKMISWDGSAWHADGDGSPYNVSGIDTATVTNIAVFKKYVWLITEASLKAWYLPINSIGGTATGLDMSSVAQAGGHLVAAMTWTLDGGYGMDDHLVFITSNGEVIVWRLTDPSSPSGIAVIGVFQIGAPVGRRCWLKSGGDLLIITNQGVVQLLSSLQSSRISITGKSITEKIQNAMSAAVKAYGSNFGWQLFAYPAANQLILNVPVSEGSRQEQYVQNGITGAWCKFKGQAANCWELFGDQPYFGASNGLIGRAWNGASDNGAEIRGIGLGSFQAYGGARQKQCHSVRFHVNSNGNPKIYGNVNADFDAGDNAGLLRTSFSTQSAVWGVGRWGIDRWGGRLAPRADWQGASTIGYSFAPFFKAVSNSLSVEWVSTDMMLSGGGTL